MMDTSTQTGSMLWFNEDKDHGFIETDDGERLFVAGDGFLEAPPVGPCAGRQVEFEIGEGADGRFAQSTRFVEEVVPRRARLRRSR
jgi:cold shock CspA family protein